MKLVNFSQLNEQAQSIQRQVSKENSIDEESVRFIGGFDVSYDGERCVCAAVVYDVLEGKIVEKQIVRSNAPVKFIPGLIAFREGPLMCEAYYSLENEPDVLMVDGNGLADDGAIGLACFVGVELGKPTIGVSKRLALGEEKGGFIFLDGQRIGKVVKTKEHANPLFVSPGHMIGVELASILVAKCVIHPHKLPEPIHVAHRVADKKVNSVESEEVEQLNDF